MSSIEARDGAHSVESVLLTSDVELASDSDPILPAIATDLGYDVAVLTWASGPLFVDQLRTRVGGIDDSALAAVVAAQWRQDEASTLSVGAPLGDRAVDPRWPELDELSDTFAALVQPCQHFLDVLADGGGSATVRLVD